jgi:hypothetical protein
MRGLKRGITMKNRVAKNRLKFFLKALNWNICDITVMAANFVKDI